MKRYQNRKYSHLFSGEIYLVIKNRKTENLLIFLRLRCEYLGVWGMVDRNNNNNFYPETVYFHDGAIVPEVMIEEDVVKFLRLDTNGPANPHETLKYYRDEGLLKPTRISKKYLYQKKEVLAFVDRLTARTNGKKSK